MDRGETVSYLDHEAFHHFQLANPDLKTLFIFRNKSREIFVKISEVLELVNRKKVFHIPYARHYNPLLI